MWQITYEDELYHHGIKGQKWGIRRYQNEDGSLTPEGEQRYNLYQYEHDREVYGSPGATRIQKNMVRNNYSTVDRARAHEQKRLEEYRKVSKRAAKFGAVVGYGAGIAGAAVVHKTIANKTGAGPMSLNKALLVYNASGIASAAVHASLFRAGTMAIGGYNPFTKMRDK